MSNRPARTIDALIPRILKLHEHQGASNTAIAAILRIHRKTVARVLKSRPRQQPGPKRRTTPELDQPLQLRWCYACNRFTPSPCVICAAQCWRIARNLPL